MHLEENLVKGIDIVLLSFFGAVVNRGENLTSFRLYKKKMGVINCACSVKKTPFCSKSSIKKNWEA